MPLFKAIIFLTIFYFVTASNVKFVNRCGHTINVIRTANGQAPVQECTLNRGASCQRSYNGNAMNFKHGWGGLTLAEFSFNNWGGLDFYDLSVIVGYDQSMRISASTGGPTVTCTYKGCPDAYQFWNDDKKTRSTRTGGTFTVTFCP